MFVRPRFCAVNPDAVKAVAGANSPAPAVPQPDVESKSSDGEANSIHIQLKGADYRDISRKDAATMLGYFTEKLLTGGFPWALQKTKHFGPFKWATPISDMEALQRLEKGDEVLMQPRRIIGLSITPDNLATIAALATPAAPAAAAAALSKSVNASTDNAGRELNDGKAIPIHNYGELKLLHEMYNPDNKDGATGQVAEVAKKITFFAMKMHSAPYPYEFYQSAKHNRFSNVFRAMAKGVGGGALAGAFGGWIMSSPVAAPIAQAVGMHFSVLGGLMIGAACYGVYRGIKEVFAPQPKDQINTFEVVDRVLKGEPVIIQKKKMHTWNLLLFKVPFLTDYGRGSIISSTDDLETFYNLSNQWPEQPQKPPDPIKVILIPESAKDRAAREKAEAEAAAKDAKDAREVPPVPVAVAK